MTAFWKLFIVLVAALGLLAALAGGVIRPGPVSGRADGQSQRPLRA